ncbi:NADH-dependent flavin oxidoreductase, Oye family [Pseudoalteromonas luteoviolacea B = ATCC 29581]|nr:NADH-dependent flavin oxidoreductase, Oye family [Pseudoalteromonas luteoviolacea B = ATCC 29581]
MTAILFEKVRLNESIELDNRIIMAPLTRCMADDNLVPTDAMATYYARRAGAGLIISEAIIIRPDAQGYPNTPGLFSAAQVEGWKKVTQAVHDNGGKIFAQLWHVGRVAHPHFFGGEVLAPSAIKVEGSVPRMRDLTYVTPKAVTLDDITTLVADYAKAAKNAREAGFDGVEIHGANGYLIDQFLHYTSNERQDEYGQTPENMARFALEVVGAVTEAIGNDRVALRLSPGAYFNLAGDPRDRAVFDYLIRQLNQIPLAYLHAGIFDDEMQFDYLGGRVSDYMRNTYEGLLVGVGGYTATSASHAIENNRFDLVAIGRPFIANPDYVEKVKHGKPVTAYSEDMLATLV